MTRQTPRAQSRITRRTYLGLAGLGAVGGLAGCLGDDDSDSDFLDEPDEFDAEVAVVWFWGDGCPVCADQRPFVEELHGRDGVSVLAYEVYDDQENQERFQDVIDAYGIPTAGVPTLFVGERYWVGDDDRMRSEIEAAIEGCDGGPCSDPRLLE